MMNAKSRLASQRNKAERSNPFIKGLLPERALALPTLDQYHMMRDRWEQFKKEIEEPQVIPNLDTIKTFLWWTDANSKGQLSDKVTLSTMSHILEKVWHILKRYYDLVLSDEVYDEAKNYLRYDLADELGLENIPYDKEFTDWEDMKLAVRHTICTDDHKYMTERSRLHIVLMFLLISDAGDRLGAIVRSSSRGNRDLNVALLYEDVQFFLRPLPTPNAQPEIKMIIRYNNRKGEDDPEQYLEQSYFQDPDLPQCLVLWFLALAFLDEAFQGCTSATELFSKRNTGTDILIQFKDCKAKVPILRQWDRKCAATSKVRALSPDTITKDGQRIFRDLGCATRFTFYCTRRAVFNDVVDAKLPKGMRSQF